MNDSPSVTEIQNGESYSPDRKILKSLAEQLSLAMSPPKRALMCQRCGKEWGQKHTKYCCGAAYSFWTHHPILRAICGGAILVRSMPADAFMPNAMRWTLNDCNNVLLRVRSPTATCSADSNGWDNVVKTVENAQK